MEDNLDVHAVNHEGNIVLVMTPRLASIVRCAIGGIVNPGHPIREACDLVYHIMEEAGTEDIHCFKGHLEVRDGFLD